MQLTILINRNYKAKPSIMNQLIKNRLLLKLNFIVMLLGSCLLLQAAPRDADSTGSISGRVADKDGVALPGASVHLKGTTITVSSSQTGTYSILNLAPGSYTVVTSYMGFETSESTITLGPNQKYNHNITLQLGKTGLQSVLVTASREGQAKALNQQRMADNIKQVISADLMGRFPDLNVAEALQRLPGVTISRNKGEGATIQLRGTPGGFTNINVNGEQVMGTQENGERNASLDGVSLDVLNSMEVTKTLTPDMDGDAIAGAVNMKTPVAGAGKKNLKVELAGNYNGMSEKAGHVANLSYGTRLLRNDGNPNGKLGLLVTGSTYGTKNGYDALNAEVWQPKDFGDGNGKVYFPTDIRMVKYIGERRREGLSGTVDYVFSPSASIVANAMYNRLEDITERYRKRTRMQTNNTTRVAGAPYKTTRGRSYNEYRDQNEKTDNLNLTGEFAIGKLKIDAGGFYNKSKYVSEATAYNFITGNIPMEITDISTDYPEMTGSNWKGDGALFTYNTVELDNYTSQGDNMVGRLNFTIPYSIGGNSAQFKFGGKYKRMHNERFRPNTAGTYTYAGASADGKLTNFAGNPNLSDDFLDGHYQFGLAVNAGTTRDFFQKNRNTATFTFNTNGQRLSIDPFFYDAVEQVTSAYMMNRIQFKKWMMLAGVRMEYTDVDYEGNVVEQDMNEAWVSTTRVNAGNHYIKVLPNLQAKYDIDKTTLIRGAVTFGYSRPTFTDLVPGRVLNNLGQTITDGNPGLDPAFSTNLDLMAEKYLNNLGILSAGVFYKSIDKFQYKSVTQLKGDEFPNAAPYVDWQWFRTLNGDKASVFGVELNAQANLTFLPGILKGFSLMANYTYTKSKADAQLRKDLRLPGQASSAANGSLSFTYKKFSIQGNVNYNGSYTIALGAEDATDVIRDSRVQFDANTNYMFSNSLTVYAEVVNLTNAPQRTYFGAENRIYGKQYYSTWGRLGVKLRF
jgi:TonB-dependent receptor